MEQSTATPTPTLAGAPSVDAALNLMTIPAGSLMKRAPITLPPNTSIRAAAQHMSEKRVSSILIEEQGHLFGLITDRDLRNRVIAAGLDTERPIMDIATLAPFTVGLHDPAFNVLLLMARHNVHHVPVLDGQQIKGMITVTVTVTAITVTAITDAITTRLLQLGEAQLGPTPVDHVWVAAPQRADRQIRPGQLHGD